MIREGKSKEERFKILKDIAEYQIRILNEAQNISNRIEKKENRAGCSEYPIFPG